MIAHLFQVHASGCASKVKIAVVLIWAPGLSSHTSFLLCHGCLPCPLWFTQSLCLRYMPYKSLGNSRTATCPWEEAMTTVVAARHLALGLAGSSSPMQSRHTMSQREMEPCLVNKLKIKSPLCGKNELTTESHPPDCTSCPEFQSPLHYTNPPCTFD